TKRPCRSLRKRFSSSSRGRTHFSSVLIRQSEMAWGFGFFWKKYRVRPRGRRRSTDCSRVIMITGMGKRPLEPVPLQPATTAGVLSDTKADAIPLGPRHHWVVLETDFGRCTLDVGLALPSLAEVA